MGEGRKGSPDKKKGVRMRDDSPAQEDSRKCGVCGFPLLVAVLQLLLGVAVAAVAFLMTAISPSLSAREAPHWAGIILCFVSVVGFVLYCINYQPDEKTSMQFFAKLLYFILCSAGLVLSLLAVAFAGHHHSQSSGFSCGLTDTACLCVQDPLDPIARPFVYEGVSDCGAITETLRFYFLLQILLNLAQALVCTAGAFIMWKHRYQVFFSGLQISSPSSQLWQKV